MSVDFKHKEYEKRIDQWTRCRDTVNGTDAVKDAGTRYLPALSGQNVAEYDAYRSRALFYGATGKTLQGLSGLVFKKDPTIEYPNTISEQLNTITIDGVGIVDFSRFLVNEVLITGRVGVLVDAPSAGSTTQPIHRAYAAIYEAENIVNWRTTVIDGVEMLVMVVLRETYEEIKEGNSFEVSEKTQYRVLTLRHVGAERFYRQEVYRKIKMKNGAESWVVVPNLTVDPSRSGVKLDFIPFCFISTKDLTTKTCKPPLLDLVDVNLSHYRTSADLEHGAHYTALPTPWAAGFNPENELRIGSGVAWITDDANGKVGYLEFTGQGLNALRELRKDKEQLMAILGARLIEESKRSVEAAETHRIRQAGDASSLLSITCMVSMGIEKILRMMAWWSNISDAELENISFSLNEDFVSTRMTPQELTALMQAWQGGAISQDTFLWNLRQGELLPPEHTIEDEKDMIDVEGIPRENDSLANVEFLDRRSSGDNS